jgi:hypothetical protein
LRPGVQPEVDSGRAPPAIGSVPRLAPGGGAASHSDSIACLPALAASHYVCMCVRARVRACACVRVRACVYVCASAVLTSRRQHGALSISDSIACLPALTSVPTCAGVSSRAGTADELACQSCRDQRAKSPPPAAVAPQLACQSCRQCGGQRAKSRLTVCRPACQVAPEARPWSALAGRPWSALAGSGLDPIAARDSTNPRIKRRARWQPHYRRQPPPHKCTLALLSQVGTPRLF